MTKLSDKDIKYIADLAKLNITKDFDKFKSQLISIIDYFNDLSSLDIKEPASSVGQDLTNVLSEDVADFDLKLSEVDALSSKDNTQNGYFVTKNVFEDNIS